MKVSCIFGFTLIELMIVVIVLGILGTIAYPSYIASARKAKRASAKVALFEMASLQERFFIENNSYSDNLNANSCQLGYPAITSDGYYNLSLTATPATKVLDGSTPSCTVTAAATGFTVTATATGTQTADTQCFAFSLTQTANKTSEDINSNPTTNCW